MICFLHSKQRENTDEFRRHKSFSHEKKFTESGNERFWYLTNLQIHSSQYCQWSSVGTKRLRIANLQCVRISYCLLFNNKVLLLNPIECLVIYFFHSRKWGNREEFRRHKAFSQIHEKRLQNPAIKVLVSHHLKIQSSRYCLWSRLYNNGQPSSIVPRNNLKVESTVEHKVPWNDIASTWQ